MNISDKIAKTDWEVDGDKVCVKVKIDCKDIVPEGLDKEQKKIFIRGVMWEFESQLDNLIDSLKGEMQDLLGYGLEEGGR